MTYKAESPVIVSTISGLTHSTFISSGQKAFLSTVPDALMPIYTKAQLWYQWGTAGYVPTFHTTANGILQTNIGVSITDTIARVLGGNIVLNSKNNEMCDWFHDEQMVSVFNKAIRFAVKGGTSLLKLNRQDDVVYGDAFRVDNFIASADRLGRVNEAKVFIDYMETSKKGQEKGYWLIEHRYIEGGKGYCRYYISKSELSKGGATKGLYISYLNCPGEVKEWVDSHGIALDVPVECDFGGTLGVFLLKVRDLGIDANNPYGESFINPILSDLYEYEYNEANKVVDMYTGRSRVMVGQQFVNDSYGPISGIDNYMLLQVPNNSMDAGKPEALQFDYRVDEHIRSKDEILESMASKIGISATTIGSHLKGDTMKTATEITTENDITSNFAAEIRRDYIVPFVIRTLKAAFPGVEFSIRFPTSGFTSLAIRMNQAKELYVAGLATVEQSLRIMYPDMEEEQLHSMAESIKAEKKIDNESWLKAEM